MFFGRKGKPGGEGVKKAKKLNEKMLKCVTERTENGDKVISRSAVFLYRDGFLEIYDGPDVIFKCRPEEMEAGELMSLEGIVITAPDYSRGGETVTIVAYYKYWREVSN